VDGHTREALAQCVFGYYDGQQEVYFEGALAGTVSEQPSGNGGYGWDPIFIPEGYSMTRAELSPEDDHKTYMLIKPIEQVRAFLLED
jgi:inosine/xanthosine triphosphate pyrophosphatase family protein